MTDASENLTDFNIREFFTLSSRYPVRSTYTPPTFASRLRELRKKVNIDEKDEQDQQDISERTKQFVRMMRSIESDPPYGSLNITERADVDLIVQNADVSAYTAAEAYVRSSGDIVNAIISLM